MADPIDKETDLIGLAASHLKRFGRKAVKQVKKVIGIHSGPLSEANPKYYVVVSNDGAIVRKTADLNSAKVSTLKFGDMVAVVEKDGRRARIIDPVEGWISSKAANGDSILEAAIFPDPEVQARNMNARFDKLKAVQNSLATAEAEDTSNSEPKASAGQGITVKLAPKLSGNSSDGSGNEFQLKPLSMPSAMEPIAPLGDTQSNVSGDMLHKEDGQTNSDDEKARKSYEPAAVASSAAAKSSGEKGSDKNSLIDF